MRRIGKPSFALNSKLKMLERNGARNTILPISVC
jgi:hypothetical protein